MQGTSYTTRGGIRIQRETWIGPYEREHDTLARTLDDRRGVLLSSSFEFPGRYTRLDMGFVDPPLVLTARDRDFAVEALNARGRRSACGAAGGRDPACREGPRRRRGPRQRHAVPGRAAQPATEHLLGTARLGRTVRQRRGRASRAVRRVRLRPGLPVRADAAQTAASGGSARSRALSAGRDPDRRSYAPAFGGPSL